MILTTATTTFSNASSCSLFIILFRFLLPDNLLTFSVPVSPRSGATLRGGMTFGILAILAARGLTEDAKFSGATGGATLRAGMAGMAGMLLPLPFLDGLIGTGGADLSVGGASLGTASGAATGRG